MTVTALPPPTALKRSILVMALAIASMAVIFWLDLTYGARFNGAVLYPTVFLTLWWVRDRRALWALFVAAACLSMGAYWVERRDPNALLHRTLLLSVLLVLAVAFDHLITQWAEAARRQEELQASYAELAAREEEIARQNEELQSQTEELERQSTNLSVANQELQQSERSLGVLLELSRGLSIDMSRGDAMSRICQTLHALLDHSECATAVLLRRGDRLHVACHSGFGAGGLVSDDLPLEGTFTSLVFAHGRTGYIEDLALRPELQVPQPAVGPRLVSVISTPLRSGGRVIGAIEGYHARARAWTSEEVGLIESLASQTTVTLRSDELFEEVAQQRQRFETVFRTAPVGMAFMERGSNNVRYNPAGALLMGLPAETDIALADVLKNLRVYRDGTQRTELHLAEALRTGAEVSGQEMEVVLSSGRRLSLLYGIAPIRDGEGNPTAAVSAFVDVTPMKDLQRELDVRRREAEEASVRKTRFLAAVSHDVRTPANAISLLAELIRRTAGLPGREGEIAEMAKELHSSSMALVNLLGDVLDVTRFDAGRIELQESEFDLRALLQLESQHLMPLARERNLDFALSPGPVIWLRTDKIKLARVIGNLVGNAIKFTDAGSVRLSCNLAGNGDAEIHVVDTGPGIALENLTFIFDEFFQLRNPERDRNKGNGLGLTICKRLADAMGAQLKVESELGKGSTFSVVFPAKFVVTRP
jgi:PAS domain S-box-containing protein